MQEKVKNISFSFKAGEFFQNNAFVLPVLVDHVIQQATRPSPTSSNSSSSSAEPIPSLENNTSSTTTNPSLKYLVDAYCGSGLFALSSAKYFEKVYGIEISKQAVDCAKRNAKDNRITNIQFQLGYSEEIFKTISFLPSKHTVVVIDPPRAGCSESFLNQLISFRPKRIVYVACDPATQARDTQFLLQHDYQILDITPFDLFPQTRHIENVITLEDYSTKNV
jgi:tRNA/tmRNA/rRNA uracil-C5-methylase (TrmA/RlmC/RlmD family)